MYIENVACHFVIVFQDYDDECVEAYKVKSEILVLKELPLSNIQGEILFYDQEFSFKVTCQIINCTVINQSTEVK